MHCKLCKRNENAWFESGLIALTALYSRELKRVGAIVLVYRKDICFGNFSSLNPDIEMTLGYLFNQRDWNTYIVVEYTRRGIRYLCGIICDQKLIRWTKKDPNLWKNPIWGFLSILIMSLIAMDHIFLFWSFWQKIKQPYPVLGSSFHEGLFSSPVKIVLHTPYELFFAPFWNGC